MGDSGVSCVRCDYYVARSTTAELITRNFREGLGTREMPCVYEVLNGRFQKVSFALGEKLLPAEAGSA